MQDFGLKKKGGSAPGQAYSRTYTCTDKKPLCFTGVVSCCTAVRQRSIVIHGANGAGRRITCANVVPINAYPLRLVMPLAAPRMQPFTEERFRLAVNHELYRLGHPRNQITVLDTYTVGEDRVVRAVLEGPESQETRDIVTSAVQQLSMPIPPSASSISTQISVYTIVMSMIFILFL